MRGFIWSIAPFHQRAIAEGKASLHFLHVALPESPLRFTPSGRLYKPDRLHGNFGQIWSDEPWWANEAQRRHTQQVRFVDRLLGELVQELRSKGLYDDALLVVTSAFGLSFWPGQSRLGANFSEHPEDVLAVPLFIKRPGQRKAVVDIGVRETIDILPTLAQLLGIPLSGPVDGCSVLRSDCPPRRVRKAMVYDNQKGRRLAEFAPEITGRRVSLDRRLATSGSGAHPKRLYGSGRFAELVGKSLADLRLSSQVAGSVVPNRQGATWKSKGAPEAVGSKSKKKARRRPRRPKRELSSPRFVGILSLVREAAETPQIALAVNGRVEAVVPAPFDRRQQRVIAAIFPETSIHEYGDEIALFIIEGEADDPRLTGLELAK